MGTASAIALERHAAEQLHFIRNTMERASLFTALPGWGGVVIGCTAFLAGHVAQSRPLPAQFTLWMWEAAAAIVIGAIALVVKAQRTGQSLTSRPARRALFSFCVPLLVGAMLTLAFYRIDEFSLFAGLALCLYGVAIVAAGAHSVRIVPAMGLSFVAFGGLALFSSPTLGNLWMTSAFGGLHVVFGLLIARRYGG